MAVLSAAFMSFVGILTETSLNVSFPTMMKQFNVSLATIQWTATGYLLMIAIIMVGSSFLNERFTAKQLFSTACLTFIIGSLICAFAPNFICLLTGRLISAFGAGISTPLMFNIIVEVMPKQKWGFYMGLAGLVIAMAPTLGPAFGGAVTYYFSWHWIFMIVVIFDLVVFISGLLVIEKYHPTKSVKVDWLSYVTLAAGLLCLTLGLNQISKGFSDLWLWVLLILAGILLWLYTKFTKHSKRKLLDLTVFRSSTFIYGIIIYFLLQFINIGTSFVLPNYIQIVGQQSSLIGGLVILPGNIIAGLLNPYFGRLYDHVGAKIPLYLGGGLVALSCLLFALLGINLTAIIIVSVYTILMLGHRMAFSNTMAEALKEEPNSLQADATALFQTAQQLAGSIGTTVLVAIISTFQNKGGASYAQLTAQGSQVAFCFTTGLSVIILLNYYLLFKHEK